MSILIKSNTEIKSRTDIINKPINYNVIPISASLGYGTTTYPGNGIEPQTYVTSGVVFADIISGSLLTAYYTGSNNNNVRIYSSERIGYTTRIYIGAATPIFRYKTTDSEYQSRNDTIYIDDNGSHVYTYYLNGGAGRSNVMIMNNTYDLFYRDTLTVSKVASQITKIVFSSSITGIISWLYEIPAYQDDTYANWRMSYINKAIKSY